MDRRTLLKAMLASLPGALFAQAPAPAPAPGSAPTPGPAPAPGPAAPPSAGPPIPEEQFSVHPQFEARRPTTIAVLPMDNLSLEPGVEEALYTAVYERLAAKGYAKVDVAHVREVMKRLGVTIPGLLAGFSPQKLGSELQAEALLMGQIEQSAGIHQLAYDAVVVSCSLRLVDATSGVVLWRAEQWRAAHRQWAIDPINIILNTLMHAGASRESRVTYLAEQMLRTLPEGPVSVEAGDLLQRARVVK